MKVEPKQIVEYVLNLDILKELVERETNIQDISIKCSKPKYTQARFVYFELCAVFYEELGFPSLAKVGTKVDRDHATVIHGRKSFRQLYCTSKFLYSHIYEYCVEYIDSFLENTNNKNAIKNLNSKEAIKRSYEIRLANMSEKYREVINSLSYKLNTYRKNDFVKKCLELAPEDLRELEQKFDVFFRVKQSLNKNKNERIKQH